MATSKPPEYKANQGTSEALPYGKATELNAMVEDVNLAELAPPEEDLDSEGFVDEPSVEAPGAPGPMDDLIYRPTDRPDEPITSGAPFGPGSAERPNAPDVKAGRRAIYQQLLTSPSSTPRTKALAARMMRTQ